MQLKFWPILFIPLLVNCATGPKVTACISNPSRGGFNCWDEKLQSESFIDYKDSDKMVAFPYEDAHALINFCGTRTMAP